MKSGSPHLDGALAQTALLVLLGLVALGGTSSFAAYAWHLYRLAFPIGG